MTTSYTLHTQVTKTEDVKNRRRVTQQASSVRVFAEKSFLEGKGILNPGQTANMFGSAEVLYLSSDQPLNVSLLDPETDNLVTSIPNTRSASFDVADTGDSYKVVIEVSGPELPANIEWFAFDNFSVGSITGTSFMLQEQVNQLLSDLADVQSNLALLQTEASTNTLAIASLQTQITSLQSQLILLDTTVSSNQEILTQINLSIVQLSADITELQNAVLLLQLAQAQLELVQMETEDRVDEVETVNEDQTARIEALRNQVNSIQNSLDLEIYPTLFDNQSRIDINEVDIEVLQDSVSTAQEDLDAAEAAVANNTSIISGNSGQLQAIFTALGNTDGDILSLQQVMSTTVQSVSENSSDILELSKGGWPVSLSAGLPDNSEVARLFIPYDLTIPIQNSSAVFTRSAPASSGATITLETSSGSTAITITFDDQGGGVISIPSEVSLVKGDYLTINTGILDGLEAPSFVFDNVRNLNLGLID